MAKESASKAAAARKPAAKRTPDDTYTDPKLREKLKAQIMAGNKGGEPGQWSARKSQMLTREYKKAGGGYKNRKPTEAQEHLHEWTEQDWQTSDGKRAKRANGTARYLPKEAWEQLTPAQQKATDAKKRAGSRTGKQHVENTAAAKTAHRKTTQHD
ncbi:hypothetical protein [Solirubrum puertoriconensis]|uniref:DUF5872 domain-containing protein n=1 Tax=Solirubrum puertoriconensis TaxID=1751427 RepID=A0A9X0L4P6_SOLP1|nr:hypothetical protein [Solirubrum puertoriconensis]KUG07824.1 hypothetical protein ASU33_12810 [Solirubrum puertoriconensis]